MSLPTTVDAGFEKRWAAWLKRGQLHDQRTVRRWRIALPFLGLAAAVASYFLLGR